MKDYTNKSQKTGKVTTVLLNGLVKLRDRAIAREAAPSPSPLHDHYSAESDDIGKQSSSTTNGSENCLLTGMGIINNEGEKEQLRTSSNTLPYSNTQPLKSQASQDNVISKSQKTSRVITVVLDGISKQPDREAIIPLL